MSVVATGVVNGDRSDDFFQSRERKTANSRRIVNISHRSEDDPKSKPMSLFPQAMSFFFPPFFSLFFLSILSSPLFSRGEPFLTVDGERDEDEARR